MTAREPTLSPFTIQVLSNRIGSILNEQQTALVDSSQPEAGAAKEKPVIRR